MERGSRIYPPCLATSAEARPLEPCRFAIAASPRTVEREFPTSRRCRKRGGAVKRHYHRPKEIKLIQ